MKRVYYVFPFILFIAFIECKMCPVPIDCLRENTWNTSHHFLTATQINNGQGVLIVQPLIDDNSLPITSIYIKEIRILFATMLQQPPTSSTAPPPGQAQPILCVVESALLSSSPNLTQLQTLHIMTTTINSYPSWTSGTIPYCGCKEYMITEMADLASPSGPVTGPITGTATAISSGMNCDCISNYAYQPITVQSSGTNYVFKDCLLIKRGTIIELKFTSETCTPATTEYPIVYASVDIDYVLVKYKECKEYKKRKV